MVVAKVGQTVVEQDSEVEQMAAQLDIDMVAQRVDGKAEKMVVLMGILLAASKEIKKENKKDCFEAVSLADMKVFDQVGKKVEKMGFEMAGQTVVQTVDEMADQQDVMSERNNIEMQACVSVEWKDQLTDTFEAVETALWMDLLMEVVKELKSVELQDYGQVIQMVWKMVTQQVDLMAGMKVV